MKPLILISDIPYYQQDKYPNSKALSYKRNDRWVHFSTDDICSEIDQLSLGLRNKFKEKANIGIYAQSACPQWNIVDFAIIKSGNVSVPLHGNASDDDLIHIIEDARMELIFVFGIEQAKKIRSLGESIEIYCLEELDGFPLYKELFDNPQEVDLDLDPDELATILYTSGSTGLPKGVMLSHNNIISTIKSTISLLPINHKHTAASYLPLSHVFERVAVFTFLTVGAKISYIDDPKALLQNVQQIRPHYMTSVPRVLEKVYDYINKSIKDANFVQARMVKWALTSSKKARKQSLNPLRRLELLACDILVFRRWRKVMGGRLKGLMVGAAAMPKHIAMLFSDAGIDIREGYGLTETSPIVSFNRFEAGGNRFGTVGIPLPSVKVKINEPNENGEGEIVVQGPNVMLGYYNNEKLTKEKIDNNGWFHTGDVGKFVHKRFLVITDRKKNIFKTSSGQYVAPQIVEAMIKESELVDQCMIIGYQRPYITAILIPNFPILESWCKVNNVHWTGPQYMVIHPMVERLYQSIIDENNQKLKRHEFIKKFHLLHEEWSVSSGEYTPTLKLKRKEILERYKKPIGKLY